MPLPEELSSLTSVQLLELKQYLEGMLAAVIKENADRSMCVICAEKAKEVVFYPCKHKCCCVQCGEKLKACPICRAAIAERILPFDS
jgi:hypothetical protein